MAAKIPRWSGRTSNERGCEYSIVIMPASKGAALCGYKMIREIG
jgi:hypothetical protein